MRLQGHRASEHSGEGKEERSGGRLMIINREKNSKIKNERERRGEERGGRV